MNRTDAIKLEVRRAHELKLAAAMYANDPSHGRLLDLGQAAIAWHQAADRVLDAIMFESAGRAMTASETKDVEHVIPKLTIVRGR